MLLSACGGGPSPTATQFATFAPFPASDGALPSVNPLNLPGDIVIAGSSTVFPLTELMAARFRDEGFPGNITVDSIGTGGGFERFCVAAETDIANASRPIRDSEVEACRANGREPIEFRVGTDALAVVVSAENDFVNNVQLGELAQLFSTARLWSDVRSEWPDQPVQRFSPGTDSGTFDFFVEEVFDENEGPILDADNTQFSEDDNVLVTGVRGSPYAIGYFGYAFYEENQVVLKAVVIEGIEPSTESVHEGNYPLARPLYIYSDPEIMRSKPQVAAFINFYLTHVEEEIASVGYFPASEDALADSKEKWLNAMGG